jgi:hypothetical protein
MVLQMSEEYVENAYVLISVLAVKLNNTSKKTNASGDNWGK